MLAARFCLSFLVAMLIGHAAHSTEGWTHVKEADVHPPIVDEWLALPGELRGIAALKNRNQVFAVGDRGVILRSRDAARTWEVLPSGTPKLLWSLAALNAEDTLIAVGANGTILRSRNAGETWETRPSDTDQDLYGIAVLRDRRTLIVVGANGTILRSTDGGENWLSQPGLTGQNLFAATAVGDGQVAVIAGTNGTLLRSSDAGQRWRTIVSGTEQHLQGLVALDKSTLVAVGSSGTVLRSRDAGENWESLQNRDDQNLQRDDQNLQSVAAMGDERTLVAVGDRGLLLLSVDAGESWKIKPNETDSALWGVAALADGRAFLAVGSNGTVVSSADGGATWETQPSTKSQSIWAVRSIDRGILVSVGDHGTIMRSETGGANWGIRPSGTTRNLLGLVTLPNGVAIAVGSSGTIIRSKDGGKSWEEHSTETRRYLAGIAAIKGGEVLVAVGERGTVLRSTDSGDSWVSRSSGTDQNLTCVIALSDSQTLVAVGDRGTVLRSQNGGVSWTAQDAKAQGNISEVVMLPDGHTLIAVGESGLLLRSRNGGESWERRFSDVTRNLSGVAVADNGRIIIAVGDGGSILRSQDQGQIWARLSSGVDQRLLTVAALPDGRGIVAAGDSIFLRSLNWGDDWETRPSGSQLNLIGTVSVAGGRALIAVDWSGAVLRSDNLGASWQVMTYGVGQTLKGIVGLPDETLIAVGDRGTILRSRNAGRTWEHLSSGVANNLNGVTVQRDGRTVVAVGDGGLVLVSRDAGRSWEQRPSGAERNTNLTAVINLPSKNVLVAVGSAGAIVQSKDDGATWTKYRYGSDRNLWAVAALPDGRTFVAVGDRGEVRRSTDSGDNWETIATRTDEVLWGIAALANGRSLVAVGDKGVVQRSEDGGLNWVAQHVHTDKSLRAVALTSSRPVAVGLGGAISFPNGSPESAAAADEVQFTAENGKLTLSWRYPGGAQVGCFSVLYDVVGTPQSNRYLDNTTLSELPQRDRRPGFSVTWSPRDTLRPEAGTEFRYAVECYDRNLDISWRQQLPGSQVYMPGQPISARLWHLIADAPDWLKALLAVGMLGAVWLCTLGALFVLAPVKLVDMHEALPGPKSLDQFADFADKPTAGLAKLFRFIGVALLLWSGTSRRALDAWCAARASSAQERYSKLKLVVDRRISLDLPIVLDGRRLEHPWTALDLLFRKPSVALLVCGPGGAGKTTIACQIGHRLLSQGDSRLGGVTSFPLIIDRDLKEAETGENFISYLGGVLRVMIGVPRLSAALTEALLRAGRATVIVDGLSERDEVTRRAFDPGRPGFPIMRLVVTSRDCARGNMGTVLQTSEIPPDALYTFLDSYIQRASAESGITRIGDADILEACAQLKRLLRDTPTTPLFASLWAEEVLRGGLDSSQRIQGLAELLDSYVERLLAPTGQNAVALAGLRTDLSTIAMRELGDNFTPGWLTRSQVIDVLREQTQDTAERRLNTLIDSRLIEADTRNAELMRVALDPIAEHLVARARVETLGKDVAGWRAFLTELWRVNCPAGFLDSLRACLGHRVYGRAVPPDIRSKLLGSNPLEQDLVEENLAGTE